MLFRKRRRLTHWFKLAATGVPFEL
jgi:hypothetical protein